MNVKLRKSGSNLTEVTVGSAVLYFSYETCVAFRSPATGWVVSENAWSTTTGKHLSEIDNGRTSDRVPHAEFEAKLESMFGSLGSRE